MAHIIEGSELTEGMKRALVAVAYGVRKYKDGYRSIETGERVDVRSLEALLKRELIDWESVGGNPQYIRIEMTETGDKLFEEKLRFDWNPD